MIAGRLPGRTDNEVKNYWNAYIRRKLEKKGIDPDNHRPRAASRSLVQESTGDKSSGSSQSSSEHETAGSSTVNTSSHKPDLNLGPTL